MTSNKNIRVEKLYYLKMKYFLFFQTYFKNISKPIKGLITKI